MTNPTDRPVRLLLIDDDPDDYLFTKEVVADIRGGGYTLDWQRDYRAGVDAVCKGEHDVYLIDYRIGEKTGLDLWKETREKSCHGPMILLTGQTEYEIDLAALAAGAADFLEKDRLDAKTLERSIRYTLQQHETERALEKKVAERTAELEAANDSLREAARRKDEFLATLGHELRNPLAPMRNALEIVKLGGGTPEIVARSLAILDRQVRTMIRLIDDLLDVGRYFSGKFRIDRESIDLVEVVGDTIEAASPLFEKAGVALNVTLPPIPIPVSADRMRLAQVFTNILANSSKYTESGGQCTLTVVRSQSFVAVTVTDTGMGIPPEMLPYVFQLFTQVDRTLNRAQGGLGIGLALVHRLVERHEGTVTVTSDGIGKGTTVEVRLPLNG